MNKKITPIFDENFWAVYQVFDEKYSYHFGLAKIFHFNSLTDDLFSNEKDPYEQVKQIRIYIPEKIIQNNKSKILHDNLDYVIENKIPFIQIKSIDDSDVWIVNEKIIKDNLKHENIIL
jgi:hypothetical protein